MSLAEPQGKIKGGKAVVLWVKLDGLATPVRGVAPGRDGKEEVEPATAAPFPCPPTSECRPLSCMLTRGGRSEEGHSVCLPSADHWKAAAILVELPFELC